MMSPPEYIDRLEAVRRDVRWLLDERGRRRDELAANPRNAANLPALLADLDRSISAHLEAARSTYAGAVLEAEQALLRVPIVQYGATMAALMPARTAAEAALSDADAALSNE